MIEYYMILQVLSRPAPVLIILIIFSRSKIKGDFSAYFRGYYAEDILTIEFIKTFLIYNRKLK